MQPTLLTATLLATLGAALPQDCQKSKECPSAAPRAALASHAVEQKDIVETAVAAGQFTTLAAALRAAGLVDTLRGEGPFTVFAPTDAAFAALPAGTLEELLKPENKGALTAILTYHVTAGAVDAKHVAKLKTVTTVNGQRLDVAAGEDGVRIDGAQVTRADLACSNGVIHVIDHVLLPSSDDLLTTAAKAGDFRTLAQAVRAAGLVEALQGEGPFTVFAPTDAAFAALPEGTLQGLLQPENREALASILKLHVVPGRLYSDQLLKAGEARTLAGSSIAIARGEHGVTVGGAGLAKADVEAKNGVIHVIDAVLLPE